MYVTEDIEKATLQDVHLQEMSIHITAALPHTKVQITEDLMHYWLFMDHLAVIEVLIMKGR